MCLAKTQQTGRQDSVLMQETIKLWTHCKQYRTSKIIYIQHTSLFCIERLSHQKIRFHFPRRLPLKQFCYINHTLTYMFKVIAVMNNENYVDFVHLKGIPCLCSCKFGAIKYQNTTAKPQETTNQCLHLLWDLGIYQNYCHCFLITTSVERSYFTPVPSSPLWNLAQTQHVINVSTFESVEWFAKYMSYKGNLYYTWHNVRYTHRTGFHE